MILGAAQVFAVPWGGFSDTAKKIIFIEKLRKYTFEFMRYEEDSVGCSPQLSVSLSASVQITRRLHILEMEKSK